MDNKLPRNLLPKADINEAIASGSGSDQPSKRRVISSACMPCRKRKSKCDGTRPSCGACTTVYRSRCHYDLDSDYRRKGALKKDIAQLKNELNAQTVVLEALKRAPESDLDDIIQIVRANANEGYESIAGGIQRMIISKQRVEGLSSGGLERELADFRLTTSSAKTGTVQHFGPTPNLTIGIDAEDPVLGDQVGSWTNVTTDPEFFQHLLDLYFSWSHPYFFVFSEESFYYGLLHRKQRYCTSLLVNAILALACHYSDRPEARADPNDPDSNGEHFLAEAKRLLAENDSSKMTTVQALAVMSLKEAMNSQDGTGWQYAGHMMSMTVHLGLHLPSAPDKGMDPYEIEARRVTFWGVFLVETVWSICTGRVSSFPRAATRLEKPNVTPDLDRTLWRPHGLHNLDGLPSPLEQPSYKCSYFFHNILLIEHVSEIVRMFYAPEGRITSSRLQRLHEKMQAWYRNLPEALLIKRNEPNLPQILVMHMTYHNFVIHLFRPFLKVMFVQDTKPPMVICTESANQITYLSNLYLQTYGLRRPYFIMITCVMTAAIIHLVNVSKATTSMPPEMRDYHETSLAEALLILHENERGIPHSARHLKSLKFLISSWCEVIPAKVQDALLRTETGSPSVPSSLSTPSTYNSFESPQYMETTINTREFPSQHQYSNSHTPSRSNLVQSESPQLVDYTGATNLMAPPYYHQPQAYWTPYPDAFAGIPMSFTEAQMNDTMSVAGMLGGQFPQLRQDGFMVGEMEGEQSWGLVFDSGPGMEGRQAPV